MQSVASGMGGMEMESSVIEGWIDRLIDDLIDKVIATLVAFPKLDSRVKDYTLVDSVPFEK
jgi:predicted transcriptional regulator